MPTFALFAAAFAVEPAPPCAFVDVTVTDPVDFRPIPDQTVLVVDGAIAAVGPASEVAIPEDAVRIDGRGKFLAPGLHDAHAHVNDPDDFVPYLRRGVTTVVNMSGGPQHLRWRREVEEGSLPGPHLFTTSPLLEEVTDPVFGVAVAVGSEAEARQVVNDAADAGYDMIKVHGDLEVGLYDAIVETADARDKKVVGHLSERVGLLHAAKMRQDSFEHADEFVHAFFHDRLDESRIPVAVEATVRSRAHVTPTLAVMDAIAAQVAEPEATWLASEGDPVAPLERAWWAPGNNPYPKKYDATLLPWFADSERFQQQLVVALHEGGVPLMVGTDAGWIPFLAPGEAVLTEMEAMEDAGLSRTTVLHAATDVPAAFLGTGAGAVLPGRRADLVLLPVDPRERRAWERVTGVMVGGRWYDDEALDALEREVRLRREATLPIAEALARGDVPTALAEARAAIESKAVPAAQAHWLALTLYRLERFPDCLRVLEWTAAAYPDDPDAQRLYGNARRVAG